MQADLVRRERHCPGSTICGAINERRWSRQTNVSVPATWAYPRVLPEPAARRRAGPRRRPVTGAAPAAHPPGLERRVSRSLHPSLRRRHGAVRALRGAASATGRLPRPFGLRWAAARGTAAMSAIEREGWGREGAGTGESTRRLSPHVGEVVDQFVPNMVVRKQPLVPELKGRGPCADAVLVQQRREHVTVRR